MPFIPTLSVLVSVYQGEDYLPLFFEQVQAQTIFPELELVLVLNEPSAKEQQLTKEFAARYSEEQDPAAMLCYGDYVKVSAYGREDGKRRHTPPYQIAHFRRSFAQGGAFWIFRGEVADQIGVFDEQFRVGADLEYSFRMAAKELKMARCHDLLGFFTDAAQGLSTRENARVAEAERTAIQLRYGVFDRVRSEHLDEARKMRLDAIKNGETWIPVTNYLPEHGTYIEKREILWAVGKIRNALRGGLHRIGLLPWFHRVQEMYLKRDL